MQLFDRSNDKLEWRASLVLLALTWLMCGATALTERVDRDEHMYLAAAALSAEHTLYADFAFLQMPYSVGVYRAVSAIAPGHWTLLPARAFKILISALMIACLFAVLRRFGARPLLAAALVTLLYQDDLIREMSAFARNYDLAQLCILGGMLALPLRPTDLASRTRLLAGGLCAAMAVGFKLTYLPLALLLVAWPVLVAPAHRVRRLVWIGGGAALGLVPLVLTFARVPAEVLRINLLDYHFANAELHARYGYEPLATLGDRLARAVGGILVATEHRALSALAVFALTLNLAQWSRPSSWAPGLRAWYVLAFLLAALMMAAVPRPIQVPYLAPLLFGLVMFAAVGTHRLAPRGAQTMLVIALALVALVGTVRVPLAVDLVTGVLRHDSWTGVVTQRTGAQLASLVPRAGPVATTHPIFVLESGLPVYPEFATGVFTWRAGELLGPDARSAINAAAPADLEPLFEGRPPQAIVIQTDGRWDAPLSEWARQHGWSPTQLAEIETLAWTELDQP
jgi:hypothetical protein